MRRSKIINGVYNEPVIQSVITSLVPFDGLRYDKQDYVRKKETITFTNIKRKKESIHLIFVGYHSTSMLCTDYCDVVRIVCDSSEVFTLERFNGVFADGTCCGFDDVHISIKYSDDGKPVPFIIPDSLLERICSASDIQVLGYGGEHRLVNIVTSPRVFRVYYNIAVDETKYEDSFKRLSPVYFDFWERLKGNIEFIRFKR